jgi:glycosyltransferase involved in cell wall biosynthesis
MKEKELPLVSIAIITYNQKDFLKECIDSILMQDYENIEIVVADDGSTDGTHDLLKEYSQNHPNKFVLKLSDKNQGITKNSNLAHFACHGKYIAWMGGDDLMLPGKIRKQVEYMESNPTCTVCYHNLDVFQSGTNKTLYYFNEKNKYEGDVRISIKFGTFNGACSTMVRKEKTPENGFNELVPVASDWLYWVETLHSGGTINYIDEVLGRYRRHNNNITKKNNDISQNEIDHLNSCNIILSMEPLMLNEIMYRYASILSSLRHKLNYSTSLITSLKLNFTFKTFAALMVYYVSFGKIKP